MTESMKKKANEGESCGDSDSTSQSRQLIDYNQVRNESEDAHIVSPKALGRRPSTLRSINIEEVALQNSKIHHSVKPSNMVVNVSVIDDVAKIIVDRLKCDLLEYHRLPWKMIALKLTMPLNVIVDNIPDRFIDPNTSSSYSKYKNILTLIAQSSSTAFTPIHHRLVEQLLQEYDSNYERQGWEGRNDTIILHLALILIILFPYHKDFMHKTIYRFILDNCRRMSLGTQTDSTLATFSVSNDILAPYGLPVQEIIVLAAPLIRSHCTKHRYSQPFYVRGFS
eukprot:scaffold1537_cov162-Ochromonas_danica.AAC.4